VSTDACCAFFMLCVFKTYLRSSSTMSKRAIHVQRETKKPVSLILEEHNMTVTKRKIYSKDGCRTASTMFTHAYVRWIKYDAWNEWLKQLKISQIAELRRLHSTVTCWNAWKDLKIQRQFAHVRWIQRGAWNEWVRQVENSQIEELRCLLSSVTFWNVWKDLTISRRFKLM
jgi:hypothetical protein